MVRYYTLYERPRGTKKWTRVSEYSYKKDTAIRIYQSRLLDYLLAGEMSIERCLRPVPKDEYGERF